ERALDVGGRDRGVLRVVDDRDLAAEVAADARDALAVTAALRYQHVAAGARYQRAERRLNRERAAPLERNALMGTPTVYDIEQPLAYPAGDAVEIDVPRAPVAEHRLPGAQRYGEGAGGEEIRVGAHRMVPSRMKV